MDGKISSFWIERMIALSGPEACSVFPLPPRATCRAADAGMCPKSPFHPRDEGLALLAGRSDVRASVSASELLRHANMRAVQPYLLAECHGLKLLRLYSKTKFI
jgi:hypothetical protein